ncbi:MAG: sugar-binding protein [Eubacteriales bacterium]
MKKTLVAFFLAIVLTLSMSSVFAIEPGYTYEAAKLVYPVTFDGVAAAGEWDDANTLVVNADNETFKNYGRWQGGASPYAAADLSVNYRIKWDETYLYILEERMDKAYFFGLDHAREPWMGDGTLFFLAYDNGDALWANAYEPFWVNKGSDGKTHVALRSFLSGTFVSEDTADRIGNWKFAGANASNVYTTEIAIPWTDIAQVGAIPAIAEGLKFLFTPVIPNMSEEEPFLTTWDQLNFHDRGLRDDAILDEASNPAELPKNWAGLVLTAAIIAPETEAPVTEAPATDTPAAPTTPAAQTSDALIGVALVVLLAGAAVITLSKKTSRK